MKAYWDSSALVSALHVQTQRDRVRPEIAVTRPHSLAEVFSTLTNGKNYSYPPDDAAKMLSSLKMDISFVELNAEETQNAINKAKELGVRGGQVHDLMHAHAALLSGAEVLLTFDKAYSSLNISLRVERP
jgi:predicted nucleic acid-binding protein